MKGYANHASTGEHAHAWAHVLREEVMARQLYVDFAGMNPHGRALALTLGAQVPPYEFFIERIALGPGAKSNKARSNRGGNMSGEVVQAIERWKQMKREGWDVDALTYDDGGQVTTLIGLGCRDLSPDQEKDKSE